MADSSHGVRYRPDVDGLRAVAVGLVVLYHAELAAIPGGFIGVDVFFVISGFLITALIQGDVVASRFSLAQFYGRRARRLLPALLAMVAITGFAAWWVLLPADLERFGISAAATALFSSNVLFWNEAGYFDAPSATKPLLHTWSLAVEEQFYLVYPLFLLGLRRLAPAAIAPIIVLLLVCSLVLSEWAAQTHPSSAFFLAPFRAWELLCGAVLAFGLVPALRSRWINELLAAIGLALILGSALLLDASQPFPGLNALAPCLGTVFLLYSGGTQSTIVSRWLSLRPVVFVGLISYSLYLWHWPVLVLARYGKPEPLSSSAVILALAASVIAAALSWRFVETPFRRSRRETPRRIVLWVAVAASATMFVAGAGLYYGQGWPQRLPEDAARMAAGAKDTWPRHRACEGKICIIGADGTEAPTVVLWGDSHAAVLAPAFDEVAKGAGVRMALAFQNSCPPLVGLEVNPTAEIDCRAYADGLLAEFRQLGVRHVILHARWPLYVTGTRVGAESGSPVFLTRERRLAENPARFARMLDETLDRLLRMGFVVTVLDSVPEIGRDVPSMLAKASLSGQRIESMQISSLRSRREATQHILRAATAPRGIRLVDFAGVLCDDDRCAVSSGGASLYSDDDHLSLSGARRLAPTLAREFQTAFKETRHADAR